MPVSHDSEISMRTPVTSLRSDSSLGKSPMTLVRFLIWPLTFSQALDVRRRFLWASGKAKTAKPSGSYPASPAPLLESPGNSSPANGPQS